ncbi:MAG TPA: IPT/TIG domain-containing protein, partial [Holophaga sp.]|nr:IPT/TIG domain-containing protein [Holophaga sp.]
MHLPSSTCLRILLPLVALNAGAETGPWPGRGPRVFAFYPRHGPSGTKVTLFGTQLDQVQGVALGQMNVSFLVQDARRVLFVVPPGAVSGRVLVRAAGRVLPSPGTFTV